METEYQQFVRREISRPETSSKQKNEQSLTSLQGHLEQDKEKKYVDSCFLF